MNAWDFWFWFTRPFEEFLGAIALMVCIATPIGLFALFLNWGSKRKPTTHQQRKRT
jgi:hypothetical protein